MIEGMKTNVTRLNQVKQEPGGKAEGQTKSVSSASAAPSAATDVQVSSATIADMAKQPPINLAAVNHIKSAIANGEYPVDLDLVADGLMEAYRQLKA